jgi:hypothetical protein
MEMFDLILFVSFSFCCSKDGWLFMIPSTISCATFLFYGGYDYDMIIGVVIS